MTTHIEDSSRIFGPGARTTTLDFNDRIQQDNERISQNFRSIHEYENMTTMPKTFGSGGSGSIFSTNGHQSRLIQETDYRAGSESSSSFSLGQRNPKFSSGFLPRQISIQESEYRPPSESNKMVGSLFQLGRRNSKYSTGFLPHNNGSFTREFRSEQSTSLVPQSFRLQPTLGGSSVMEDRFSTNQTVTNFRNNTENISVRTQQPVNKSTALNAGWRIPERLNENDNDDDGFKRPYLSRCIRGRSSTLSGRLFSHQSVDKYSKNLSNVNGLNVSHISRRGMDSFSESKLPLVRHNYMDTHSVTESVVSVASVKAQFLNLLENLQHSILNIVPNLPPDVGLEFDKAKEGLENIKEMSIAPSLRDDGASVVSFSTKQIASQIPDQTSNKNVNSSSVLLRSGRDLLQVLNQSEQSKKKKEMEVQPSFVTTTKALGRVDEREENEQALKTPRLFTKKISKSRMLKIKTPQATRGLKNLVINNIINLKEWYPIAVGEDLAFCGVNEEGAVVRTDPVKKRVNNRKIELINGLLCNLVGSPSNSVVLPKKILSRLKNGLTDRWRVLQKDLLDCQTSNGESKKRHSKTPRKIVTPKKKTPLKVVKKKSTPVKTVVTKASPQKREKDVGMLGRTRSGRAVKRPGDFWMIGAENANKSESISRAARKKDSKKDTPKEIEETPVVDSRKDVENTPTKKHKSSMETTPTKKIMLSLETTPTKKLKSSVVKSPVKKMKASAEKSSVNRARRNVEKSPTKSSKLSVRKSPAKRSAQKSSTKKFKSTVETTKELKKDGSVTPTKKVTKEETSTIKSKKSGKKTPVKKLKSRVQKTPASKLKRSVERTPVQTLSSSNRTMSSKSRRGVRCTPVKKVKRGIATIAKRLGKSPRSPSKTPAKSQKKSTRSPKKSPVKATSATKVLKKEEKEESRVHSSTEEAESRSKSSRLQVGRKRKATVDVSSTEIKRNRSETQEDAEVESTVDDLETPAMKTKKSKLSVIRGRPPISKKKTTTVKSKKQTETKLGTITETSSFIKHTREGNDFDEDFEFQLDGIDIPDVANVSGNPQLTRSQLRTVSMETPPLKYFNNNLRLLRSVTPVRSPDWCISQRTESEVKQFQKRRADAHKKKIKVEVKKTVIQEKGKGQNKDLKKVLDWVADKNIRSPQWHSRVLQYIIPSRKNMEQEDEEEDEEFET